MSRDFKAEFQARIRQLDRIENPVVTEVPVEMQVPEGEPYNIWKRSNKGYNQRMFINLPEEEARFWAVALNDRERRKREASNTLPDEVFFFEAVQGKTEAEDVFWNPKTLFDEENYG